MRTTLTLAALVLAAVLLPSPAHADDCRPDGSDCETTPGRIAKTSAGASLLAIAEAARRRMAASRSGSGDRTFVNDVDGR